MTDNKALRRYHAGIERALGLFDSTSEWADYIAYLSRLLKALQDPPSETDLPSKGTVARHLALCLRPSLPSGVHQKALDVYALIFSIIGPKGLAHDLPLYLPGLSHTLAFASLATRPQILSIYDDHILALSAHKIRPALRALILSLLPGIEDETSEDFENTLATFNQLRTKFTVSEQEEIFWQDFFLASITSAGRRAGVLAYMVRYLPKLNSGRSSNPTNGTDTHTSTTSDVITRPEPGLLVRCFATGLQDEQPLVQRGFLDLLVTHFPLEADIFKHGAHDSDLVVLVSAAAMVVLRRDMSLNRRLWTWFTGVDSKTSSSADEDGTKGNAVRSSVAQSKPQPRDAVYFESYGLRSLIESLRNMISSSSDKASSKAQPFRIALSLMDRWEIGGPVVEAIFVSLMQMLETYQSSAPSQEAFDEVFRSANVFFDGVEGRLIASQMIRLLDHDELDLVLFIVSNFNLEDDEMMKRHIPLVSLFVIEKLYKDAVPENNDLAVAEPSPTSLKLSQILDELMRLIPDGVFLDSGPAVEADLLQQWPALVLRFYEQSLGARKSIMLPLAKPVMTGIFMQRLCEICLHCMQMQSTNFSLLARISSILERCATVVHGFATIERMDFPTKLIHTLEETLPSDRRRFELTTSIARVLTSLQDHNMAVNALTVDLSSSYVPQLTRQLWRLLQPSTPQYHVEAIENIWRLHRQSQKLQLVESTILTIMTGQYSSRLARTANAFRFSTLWIHSRTVSKQIMTNQTVRRPRAGEEALDILRQPLLFMLDSAEVDSSEDPMLLWARSVNTLLPAFRVTFDSASVAIADQQIIGLTLNRLAQLVELAKDNTALWKSFTEQHEQSGAVLEFCSSIISKELFAGSLGVEALALIQKIVKFGNFDLDKDFVSLLITQLATSYDSVDLQGSILDALSNMMTNASLSSLSDILLPILLEGIASSKIDFQLDKWVALLCTVIPSLAITALMTNLLKITSTLCKRTEACFSQTQYMFGGNSDGLNGIDPHPLSTTNPERSVSSLLSGMEFVLARAHHQAAASWDRDAASTTATPNLSTTDLPSARAGANDHLTVVLCMQDALKVCTKLWLWRSGGRMTLSVVDAKSMHYMSSKFRARSRRILENLIEAEPQECLETLMGLWVERRSQAGQHGQILELLQTLDGARPKFMMPATFNAIYNRTNPAALDMSQRSSLSVDVNAFDLIAFLNDYTGALEDDLLDEIWTDCTTFLKEILANPLPHRQILLNLLDFVAVLCRKMDNTNFGEESRMRKELADLCARLFTAIFAIKPYGLDTSGSKASETDAVFSRRKSITKLPSGPGNALQVLHETLPDLNLVLSQSDRLNSVYLGISTNITSPVLHSKQFPQNVSPELLALVQIISMAPSATRAWKKDVLDAFNDAKFFQNQEDIVQRGWLPLIRQLALQDKTIMPELLNRLVPPAAAGLMFGVGASAARTDTDRKTQLTLRRIMTFLLSMETDTFTPQLAQLFTKMEELLTATPESSPSSSTKADIYMLFRAVLLSFSHSSQLATLWPILDHELRDLCTDIITTTKSSSSSPLEDLSSSSTTKFTAQSKLQGAKLLDLLLLMKPDEFQLHEWLFVTDTVDAIYPPPDYQPVALADQIGSTLLSHGAATITTTITNTLDTPLLTKTPTLGTGGTGGNNNNNNNLRKPWLATDESRDPDRATNLLAGFFGHLSIRVFEDNYGLAKIDLQACRRDLIADMFVDAAVA